MADANLSLAGLEGTRRYQWIDSTAGLFMSRSITRDAELWIILNQPYESMGDGRSAW